MYKRYEHIPKGPAPAPPPEKEHIKPVLKNDDILLLCVLYIVLKEGKSNNLLIFALIFIFLSGF